MLSNLPIAPPDPLLGLMALFEADDRGDKIDLGVGVFRNERGTTPVMRAVKIAERSLYEQQSTKAYVGAAGDVGFIDALRRLVLGDETPEDLVAGVQTPGGTGALRLGADLLRRAGASNVLIGAPGWANHPPIFAAAGFSIASYSYFDPSRQAVLVDAMLDALQRAQPASVVLLQASCHNPTGADLSPDQWDEVADLVRQRDLIPFIDVAYQGFGRGLEEDVAAVRKLVAAARESLIAVSCSKTFGLYRERAGALFMVGQAAAAARAARSNMLAIARANYSMPPDHGAAVVRHVLVARSARQVWDAELAEARTRIHGLRRRIVDCARGHDLDLSPLARQQGMFSQLALGQEQIQRLRTDHGIYVTGSGRINVAGLRSDDVERLIVSLGAVALRASIDATA